jgi:Flp pilus assembly protein TadB
MPVYRLPAQRNPLVRFIAMLVFVAVVAVAVVLGAVALVVVLGLAGIISLRYWWLRRGARERPASDTSNYIEGEYTVEKEEPRRRD